MANSSQNLPDNYWKEKATKAESKIQEAREAIKELIEFCRADWNNLKAGDSFPTVSSMVISDQLCDILEELDQNSSRPSIDNLGF